MKEKIFVSAVNSTWLDYPDNASLAITVYFTGCIHACDGCHNLTLQEYGNEGSTEYSFDELRELLLKTCKKNLTNKIVFSGGDPLFPLNIDFVTWFLTNNHENYDVCIYTGYSVDYVMSKNISNHAFVKCGKYVEALKKPSYKTSEVMSFASSNQELYDKNFILVSKEGKYYFDK